MIKLRDERGAALVTAMLITVLIGALGVVGLLAAERFHHSTGEERIRESALQLAEAALSAQVIPLNASWPTSPTPPIPRSCTSDVTPTPVPRCPHPAAVAESFQQASAVPGTWKVEVRDDISLVGDDERYHYGDLNSSPTPITWDSNGNGRLWIRAEAKVQDRRRSVVSLVRRQEIRVPLPRASVIASGMQVSNSGNKVLLDELGCSAKLATPVEGCATTQPGAVLLRCDPPTIASTSDSCLASREGQISPSVLGNYQGSILSAELVAMLKNIAISEGNYFTACPPMSALADPARAGGTMYVEANGATCSYTGNNTIHSHLKPGRLLIEKGKLELGGTNRFYGLILALNGFTPPADSSALVTIGGNATVQGAIYIEGGGKLVLGSSGDNLIFDERAIGGFTSWSLAALEHNSFRELTPAEYPQG